MNNDFYPSRVTRTPDIFARKDPISYNEWSVTSPLSKDQISQYEQDGYLALHGILQASEVRALQEAAATISTQPVWLNAETLIQEPETEALRSVFKIHKQCDVYQRLSADARLVNIARFLLNDDIYIHQSRLNIKPGFKGKDFYWHSDFETWHVEDGMPRMRALSMSVLLNDNSEVNGPTMFMPGSHKVFVSCVGETPDDHYKQSLRKQEYGVPAQSVLSDLAGNGIRMPTGPAGTIVIFDCNIMHGSNSNISPFPRSNAFFVYNAISNRLGAPFGPEKPRPEFIATRNELEILNPVSGPIAAAA